MARTQALSAGAGARSGPWQCRAGEEADVLHRAFLQRDRLRRALCAQPPASAALKQAGHRGWVARNEAQAPLWPEGYLHMVCARTQHHEVSPATLTMTASRLEDHISPSLPVKADAGSPLSPD